MEQPGFKLTPYRMLVPQGMASHYATVLCPTCTVFKRENERLGNLVSINVLSSKAG